MAIRHFARLKIRILRNGLRGRIFRVWMFVLGTLVGLWFSVMGFLAMALPALDSDGAHDDVAVMMLGLGGGAVVLGWVLLPLVFFGVDETLDPARFALLPIPRRTLIAGLTVSGLVGIPAVATLLATSGSVITAAAAGGLGAAIAQGVGVLVGLLLCLVASRALTSAFAAMLRSRRMRDLAAVLLAVLAALLGPLQIAVMGMAENADLDHVASVARVVSWTPLGAPYTLGLDVADGNPLAAVAKLIGTVAVLAGLLWWWSRSLESALVGTASVGTARPANTVAGGPVSQLFPWAAGWARRDRFGALVAREARYWWRDARRRSSLITIAVVGVFVPLMLNLGGPTMGGERMETSPVMVTVSMLFVGTLAALTLINQFGYDGSAYAAHVAIGIPGRTELQARVTAYTLYMAPLLVVIAVVVAVLLGEPQMLSPMLGGLVAAYGVGVAISVCVSVLGAYSLPETSNPFAISSGAGMARSMFSFVAMFGTMAASAPFVAGAVLLDDAWTVLALPIGLVYGIGAVLLACYICGDVLDRRAPELLQEVTPRA